jgi:outer membrane protein
MMQRLSTVLLVLMLAFAAPAIAQTAGGDKPLKIGVIDLQAVLQQTKAGKSIQDQLEKLRKNFQDEFTKQEEKLRGADQELAKLRPSLSAEEFTKKRRDFEKSVAEAQRGAQDKRRELEQAVGKATNELQAKVFGIVGKIAEDRSITLVLSRGQVFLAQRSIDITKDVIANLDAQITNIPIQLGAAPKSDKKTN